MNFMWDGYSCEERSSSLEIFCPDWAKQIQADMVLTINVRDCLGLLKLPKRGKFHEYMGIDNKREKLA
jgi:hypothetical protein